MNLLRRILFLLAACAASLAASCGGGGSPEAKHHCPMHPAFIADRNAKCSICGMDLVPVDPSRTAAPATPAAPVAGRVALSVDPAQLARIGLLTTPVAPHSVTNTLRLAAAVDFDETRRAVVSPRAGGFVEAVHANATGIGVQAGQPLLRLHSPMVRAGQIDLLEAVKLNDERLITAARTKLRLWGLAESQLDAVIADGKPGDTFELLSPASGRVIAKHVRAGQAVMEGMALYELADLSTVWIRARAHESDVRRLRAGQTARLTVPALAGHAADAVITRLAPALDPASRTLEVLLECPNPDGRLLPGMWGEVSVRVDAETGLGAPASAFIDTGARVLVFVDHGDGDFEPREVSVGARGADVWMVRDGLVEGERVVTRALFLIDAESQIQASMLAPAASTPAPTP